MNTHSSRDNTIDILRGIAICTMILSNAAGEFLVAPHPFWLRILGSLAAPLFVGLAGYSVGQAILVDKKSPHSFFLRGLKLILVGAMIDTLIWVSFPFVGMDVLYLIGLSTILGSYILQFPKKVVFFFIICMFSFNYYIRTIVHYSDPISIHLSSNLIQDISSLSPYTIFLSWTLNGWFPIVPWVNIFLLGALSIFVRPYFANWDFSRVIKQAPWFIISLVLGVYLWPLETKLEVRSGYTELFYPPTISYYLVYLAFIFFMYALVEKFSRLRFLRFFQILGMRSLFNYVLHFICIAIVRFILGENFKFEDFSFASVPSGILLVCFTFSWILLYQKEQKKKQKTSIIL